MTPPASLQVSALHVTLLPKPSKGFLKCLSNLAVYLSNWALPPSQGLSQGFLGPLKVTEPAVMGQGIGINKTETFEDPKDLSVQQPHFWPCHW